MSETLPPAVSFNDQTMLVLAREIAMDIHPLEKILQNHKIGRAQWSEIQGHTLFQNYLRQCVEEWNSAVNTAERVKLKSMAFVEEALPEFYARAHDSKESLNAKVEVLKTVARFANLGGTADIGGGGDRLSVTINLGADQKLKFERDVTPRTIEGDTL